MSNPQEIELGLYKQVFLMRNGQGIEGKKNAVKELADWLFFHTDNVNDFHTAYEMAKELISGSAPRTSPSIEELTGVIDECLENAELFGLSRSNTVKSIASTISNLLNGEGNDG